MLKLFHCRRSHQEPLTRAPHNRHWRAPSVHANVTLEGMAFKADYYGEISLDISFYDGDWTTKCGLLPTILGAHASA